MIEMNKEKNTHWWFMVIRIVLFISVSAITHMICSVRWIAFQNYKNIQLKLVFLIFFLVSCRPIFHIALEPIAAINFRCCYCCSPFPITLFNISENVELMPEWLLIMWNVTFFANSFIFWSDCNCLSFYSSSRMNIKNVVCMLLLHFQ